MSYYPPPQQQQPPSDPQQGLPQGWIARWDGNSQHWFYVDTRSGQSSWERPRAEPQYAPPSGPPPGQYPPQQQYGGPQQQQQQYGGPQQQQQQQQQQPYGGPGGTENKGAGPGPAAAGGASQSYYSSTPSNTDDNGYHQDWQKYQDQYAKQSDHKVPDEPKKKSSNKNAILGVGAGLLGGMFVAHEAHEVGEKWDEEKYKMGEHMQYGEQRVEGAPYGIASAMGAGVGGVEAKYDNVKDDIEDIPERVDQKWDNFKDDVEDAPDNVASWTGDKVGEVEGKYDNFKDDVDDVGDAFDSGRQDGYDDERDDDNNDYDDDNGGGDDYDD